MATTHTKHGNTTRLGAPATALRWRARAKLFKAHRRSEVVGRRQGFKLSQIASARARHAFGQRTEAHMHTCRSTHQMSDWQPCMHQYPSNSRSRNTQHDIFAAETPDCMHRKRCHLLLQLRAALPNLVLRRLERLCWRWKDHAHTVLKERRLVKVGDALVHHWAVAVALDV